MTTRGTGGDGEFDLTQFEKNRFFQGKLMTAQDMAAEQEYHSKRLQTLSRFAVGTGILWGLEVSSVEEDGDELRVTVEPGVAIDRTGRPIVVEHTTTRTLPAPSGTEVYLHIRYSEVDVESVPVPDVDGASGDQQSSNRAVEAFELTYQGSPPEALAAVDAVNNPVADATEIDDQDPDLNLDRAPHEMASEYHERVRTGEVRSEDPSVFIGAYERSPGGVWVERDESVRRQLVYDNEMLFAMLVDHLTDTDNPHHTPTNTKPESLAAELDDIESFGQKLEVLQSELAELKRTQRRTNRFVMRKSIKDRVRFFDRIATRFDGRNGEACRIAREIAESAERGVVRRDLETVDEYRSFLRTLLELDVQLGEALEDAATEESLDRYVRAVGRLRGAIEAEDDLLELALAQDAVCEAADSLEILFDVVPNR